MNGQANKDCTLAGMIKGEMPRPFRERETEELLYDLTNEYCSVSSKLKKLKKAIEANHESVSEDHKKLWKLQADYMDGYKRTLAERIKDILNNN